MSRKSPEPGTSSLSSRSSSLRKNNDEYVSPNELSPGLLDLHSFDTELRSEIIGFGLNDSSELESDRTKIPSRTVEILASYHALVFVDNKLFFGSGMERLHVTIMDSTPKLQNGFGSALNIGTLVAAAERREKPIESCVWKPPCHHKEVWTHVFQTVNAKEIGFIKQHFLTSGCYVSSFAVPLKDLYGSK
ncbi:hypothetical protein V6N11_022659 [Hibiscus sabdariffa]|uniref:Uncharacterized protein n=1 Tax=Hibiscus sabdariffa TaxID=183260 RepID=A0ABR2TKG7_9ROSI